MTSKELTSFEKKIIAVIQEDIPVVSRPYHEMARSLGITEEALLTCLMEFCNRGVIRRFGATIRHQKSGFSANAMAAWLVDELRVDDVGKKMARFSEVTHCYRRNPSAGWPYNLYTMIHAGSENACREIAKKISLETRCDKYSLLFSRRELKKTSMTYFP